MTFVLRRGDLDSRIRIERPVADSGFDGAGSSTWELVTEAWAQVRDLLPSRGERVADGITTINRPTRVRMAFRTGITSDMRIVFGDRIMQIISGPAVLGRRVALEMLTDDYSGPGAI